MAALPLSVEVEKKTVFQSDSNWCYRIPALFYENDSQTLLSFAEQRKTFKDSSTKNLVMREGCLKDSSGTIEWKPQEVLDKAYLEGHRPMNPCPVYDKTTGTLFLFFICVEGTVEEQYQINNYDNKARLCYITKKGNESWSEIKDLTDELTEIKNWATFAVGPGHGLQTKNGRLIVPMYAYVSCCSLCCLFCCLCCYKVCCCKATSYALSLYSEDHGENWKFGKMLEKNSFECQMAEFIDNDKNYIYCNARTHGGYREEADSSDESLSFSSRGDKRLPETSWGCQGSVVSIPDLDSLSPTENKWLLFTHPSKSERQDLGVYLNKSPKNPGTWTKPWIINGGYSAYSDLVYIGCKRFVVLIEKGEEKKIEIVSATFSYDDVMKEIGENPPFL